MLSQSFLNGNLDGGSKWGSGIPWATLSGIAPTPSAWPWRRTRWRRFHLPTQHIPSLPTPGSDCCHLPRIQNCLQCLPKMLDFTNVKSIISEVTTSSLLNTQVEITIQIKCLGSLNKRCYNNTVHHSPLLVTILSTAVWSFVGVIFWGLFNPVAWVTPQGLSSCSPFFFDEHIHMLWLLIMVSWLILVFCCLQWRVWSHPSTGSKGPSSSGWEYSTSGR